jgi:hypothetical protein
MQRLEVSGAVQPIYGSLGAKGLNVHIIQGYSCALPGIKKKKGGRETSICALPAPYTCFSSLIRSGCTIEPVLSGLMTGCHWPDNDKSRIIEDYQETTC